MFHVPSVGQTDSIRLLPALCPWEAPQYMSRLSAAECIIGKIDEWTDRKIGSCEDSKLNRARDACYGSCMWTCSSRCSAHAGTRRFYLVVSLDNDKPGSWIIDPVLIFVPGVYVAAFAVCLRLFRTHAPVVGRALPIWLGALFVLATAHCALSLSAMLDAFVRVIYTGPVASPPAPTFSPAPSGVPRPPPQQMPYQYRDATRYIGNRALPTNLAGLGVYAGIVLLSDLMLLYRLLVKYRYRFIWVVGPTLLTIGSFVISIIIVVKYAHIDLTVNYETLQKQLDALNLWVPPVYAISFLANLSITALMMVKTSFGAPRLNNNSLPAFATRRRHTHRTTLSADDGYVFDIDERTGPVPRTPTPVRPRTMSSRWALFAGLVESGALAPVFMLAALILYVAQDAQEVRLLPIPIPEAFISYRYRMRHDKPTDTYLKTHADASRSDAGTPRRAHPHAPDYPAPARTGQRCPEPARLQGVVRV
ncbi:hypothetical protein AG1IA_06852 [Rhizoctonia solani AG-1 IA]|uniref:Uncharacterized protein n=1 Tax=Thanatephorus cucumeris (strain AG1-IA) TaxID=983506 RepID=L8WQQ7_THACA|nr:hypothetical protein AG1IA_06852 [Rhizoctonia solani AG-1 IA]